MEQKTDHVGYEPSYLFNADKINSVGKILNHTIKNTKKEPWFGMIKDQIKKEEYKEIKPYWISRLCVSHPGKIGGDFMDEHKIISYTFKDFDIHHFFNGRYFGKVFPNIKVKHRGIRIGEGKPEWGAEPGKKYFVIELGEII